MDLNRIVVELKREQDRISRAINALLEGVGLTGPTKTSVRKSGTSLRRITSAGRRRQAAAMKAYWVARRAKSGATSINPTAKPKERPQMKRGGGMTAAGRKRLSEMMKKRWAERRKAASKG